MEGALIVWPAWAHRREIYWRPLWPDRQEEDVPSTPYSNEINQIRVTVSSYWDMLAITLNELYFRYMDILQKQEGGLRWRQLTASSQKGIYELKTCANRC